MSKATVAAAYLEDNQGFPTCAASLRDCTKSSSDELPHVCRCLLSSTSAKKVRASLQSVLVEWLLMVVKVRTMNFILGKGLSVPGLLVLKRRVRWPMGL